MGICVKLGSIVEVRVKAGVRVGGGGAEVDGIFVRVALGKATYTVAVLVGIGEPISRVFDGVLRTWVTSSVKVGVGVLLASSCKTLRVPATAVST